MNSHTAKALLQDAFYQVLDNKVFRLLVIVAICFIALTFLVAFKQDEISILFGTWNLRYDDLGLDRLPGANTKELNVVAIQALQGLIVQGLAGSFGIMLSLAATAFFVPRMLEKGEADTLFSKPVGRFVLLLARYTSGVVFVGVLASVLVVGMHFGFLVRSGYSDPAFLWSVLTLVYIFAMIHAFSTVVGVFTRNSIAALLAAILFFGFNGCIHSTWVYTDYARTVERTEIESNDESDAKTRISTWDEPLLGTLKAILDGVHFALPKTHDADVITHQLRRAVSAPEFVVEDRDGGASFARDPKGFQRASEEQDVDLATQPAVSAANTSPNAPRISVSRRTRVVPGKSSRTSDATAARELVKTLEARQDLEGKAELVREQPGRVVRTLVKWSEKREGGSIHHMRAFWGSGDWMYEIDFEAPVAWKSQDEANDTFRHFLGGVTPRSKAAVELDPSEWYAQQVGWTAPLRYNTAFSIASSILFAVVMLLCARWKLSRIDF